MTTQIIHQTRRHPEWHAATYLLSTPLIADRTAAFIHAAQREIDWGGLREASRSWSCGERLLVLAAQDMWRGGGNVSLYDLLCTLDEGNFDRLLAALRMRRGRSS